MLKSYLRILLAAALLLTGHAAFAQTAGDTRVTSIGEPEIFDGRRWNTDWALLQSGLPAGRLIQNEPGESVSNAGGPLTVEFTPAADGDVTIRYFADTVTPANTGNGGVTVRNAAGQNITPTNLEGFTFASEPAGRINSVNNDKTITLPNLNGGETYQVDRWGGGGSTLTNYQLEISTLPAFEFEPEPIDYCGINEFVHTGIEPFYLTIAHEGDGGTSMTISHNGDPVTYQNLQNANDAGGGQVNFNSGSNGNFNRRASTVQFLQNVGDYFEVIKPATPPFDGEFIKVTTDPASQANIFDGTYRLGFNESVYSLFDDEGTAIQTQGPENATYRIERTDYGFAFERNGTEVHRTPSSCTDYSVEPVNIVNGETGVYRVGVHEPAVPISITSANPIVTGLDFTQASDMTLNLSIVDTANAHQWQTLSVDVDTLLARQADTSLVNKYSATVFDNDFVVIQNVDAVTGTLTMSANGRAVAYREAELYVRATEVKERIEVFSGSQVTTNAYANFGDPNIELTAIEDTDIVMITFGDGTMEPGFFLDGVANVTRINNLAHEVQILADGQLQLRNEAGSNASTITRIEVLTASVLDLPNPPTSSVVEVDVIPEFSANGKIGFEVNEVGQNFTLTEDIAGTIFTLARPLDAQYTKIELVRDETATHGVYLRANTPGTGRQSQVRMSLVDGSVAVAASGADSTNPVVLRSVVEERSITHYIEWTDPVPHTELEFAPAGTDAALVIVPAQTGQSGVLGIELFEENPIAVVPHLPVTREWVSYIDTSDGAFYEVLEYSNGVESVFQQDDLTGSLERIASIPSTYQLFTPLAPTLPISSDVGHFWFQDSGAFVMQPNADGTTLANIQVFLQDRPYGELQNLAFDNGNPLPAGAYQFQVNPATGLTSHLFTFAGPFNAGQSPGQVVADAPVPAGTQTGGPNPPRSIVQTFAN